MHKHTTVQMYTRTDEPLSVYLCQCGANFFLIVENKTTGQFYVMCPHCNLRFPVEVNE